MGSFYGKYDAELKRLVKKMIVAEKQLESKLPIIGQKRQILDLLKK